MFLKKSIQIVIWCPFLGWNSSSAMDYDACCDVQLLRQLRVDGTVRSNERVAFLSLIGKRECREVTRLGKPDDPNLFRGWHYRKWLISDNTEALPDFPTQGQQQLHCHRTRIQCLDLSRDRIWKLLEKFGGSLVIVRCSEELSAISLLDFVSKFFV